MILMRYTLDARPGLYRETGNYAVTTGAFRVRTLFDPEVTHKADFVGWFVWHHEYAHARYRHGLISLLLFPFARWLRPLFEAQADRYAVAMMGAKAARRAMLVLSSLPRTTSDAERARIYGKTSAERAARAGAS